MMVGTKDPGGGAKTGVVAPVPINTPSLRQEIQGSQGDNTGIASINRASSGGGWGSAVGGSSAAEGKTAGQSTGGGKGRGDGSSRQGGDDVFTRHFPDLRAGLEQAEKLDAVTKASSKVAPLRKPKPEPAKGQGPSLRPRAMLKPTGSAGGGSAATAAAQAAIADAVHNHAWGKPADTSSKWRPTQQSADTPPEDSPTLDSPSTQSASYVRAHGPPRRSGREAQADEHSATSASFSRQDQDVGGEAASRFGGSWGASEQSLGVVDKEASGGTERTLSGRWKEPTSSLAPPPPPTNTRWKEPKEEPRAGARRWKAKEEGQTGSGRWGRSAGEDDEVDGGSSTAASLVPSSSQSSSWKESPSDGWGLEVGKRVDEEISAAASTPENLEQQRREDSVAIAAMVSDGGLSGEKPAEISSTEESAVTTAQDISTEKESTFRGHFTQQQQSQPVISNASWEPQLPRGGGGGDLWDTQGHGRDTHPQQQGSGQGGPSTSGGTSQPWSDPWGTSGFGLAASGDQGSGSMASFLNNDPDEPRKDRYLPPALRNRTPSQGNQEDSANVNVPSVDDATERIPSSLPDVVSTEVSPQDLVIPGGGGIGTAPTEGTITTKGSLYEQQGQEQQKQQLQQQAPLEDWQQGGAQASHQLQQDQTGHPVEQQLHQPNPIHQSHQSQPAQPLHLHEHAHLDRGFQRNPAESFSTYQSQDRQKHQLQEHALHQFQPEQFQAQVYHNQQQAGRAPLPEHLHRPPYQSDHMPVQRQQFQVQIPQQIQAPQQRAQHSLHQPYQQQQPQRPQQHGHHPHQQGYQQGHQPLDMSRQTNQAQQQMHIQQQHQHQHQHQQMQHPSSAFMMPSQGMGYADPRAARAGGLGGLPVQMASSTIYDVPPAQQQGHTIVDVKTGKLVWEPEERKEEEPYSCAGSCGCPVPFNWRESTFQSALLWVKNNRVEWLAGITTGLTAVPTAVAFAILAGVKPAVGLRGTWIIMLVMALFGGRTGMVYSNSGSMGVIIEPFVEQEGDLGEEMVFYAFILAGIIQIGVGFLGVAKLLRLMPVSVIIGFVNGLAIVLFLAQMKNFQVLPNTDEEELNVEGSRRLNSFSVFTDGSEWISGSELWYTLLIVVITMILIVVYPLLIEKATGKWRGLKMIPPILVGIVGATVVEWVIVRGAAGYGGTRTLEDLSEVTGSFPKLAWFDDAHDMPPLNSHTFSTILPTAISLMAVGLVESLMTVRLVNEITQTSSNIHREAIVGGVGNLVAGAFGGQGGNSEIGLTMVNVQSGGRTRIAATVSGLLVLLVVLVASPIINLIPLAGLVGVMLVISFNTFDWGSTLMVLAAALPERYRSHKAVFEKKISRADALIIVVVTVATPFTNLAIAVGIGIAVACLAFVWHNSEAVTAQSYYRAGYDVKDPAIIKVYEVMGNLFFASSETFLNIFDHRNDPPMVEVHLHTADIEDFSAMKTLETLGERYSNAGKHLRLRRIKKESLRVLTKAQALMTDENVEVVMDDDPLLPQVSRRPRGVGEALVFNFFDRDPYTRRHRSRSMAELPAGMPELGPGPVVTDAVENGVGNGHVAGVPRLPSV
eukprot:g15546.t3